MGTNTGKMTKEIRLVVADMAGTLLDFGSRAPAQAFVELFLRHGVSATEKDARGPMGMQKRDHISKMLEVPHLGEQWKKQKGACWGSDDLDALYQEFISIQLDVLPKHGDLIPGALECLQELRQSGILAAGTTGYNREMASVVMHCMESQGLHFDCFSCAEDVISGRPAPWMIYRSMEKLEVFPPELVINVGDTIPDILSGRNAGVWSVGITDTGNMTGMAADVWNALSNEERSQHRKVAVEAMNMAGAHYVLNTIGELPKLTAEINARLSAGERP